MADSYKVELVGRVDPELILAGIKDDIKSLVKVDMPDAEGDIIVLKHSVNLLLKRIIKLEQRVEQLERRK